MSSDSAAIIQRLEKIFDQHYSGISSKHVNNRASSVNERYSVAPQLKRMNSGKGSSIQLKSVRIHNRVHSVDSVIVHAKSNHGANEENAKLGENEGQDLTMESDIKNTTVAPLHRVNSMIIAPSLKDVQSYRAGST